MDGCVEPLVRTPPGTRAVPGAVPGAPLGDHATAGRVVARDPRGERCLPAAVGPAGRRAGLLPAGGVAPAARRVRVGRAGLPAGEPMGMATAAGAGAAAAG